MNGRQIPMDRIPLTEAEKNYLGPIIDRYEQTQREAQQTQRDIDAVIILLKTQHAQELGEDPTWQLGRDAFVRPRMEMPPPTSPNGEIGEDAFSELMKAP